MNSRFCVRIFAIDMEEPFTDEQGRPQFGLLRGRVHSIFVRKDDQLPSWVSSVPATWEAVVQIGVQNLSPDVGEEAVRIAVQYHFDVDASAPGSGRRQICSILSLHHGNSC